MLAEPCSPGVFDDGIMIRHLRAFLLGLGPEVFLYLLFIYLLCLELGRLAATVTTAAVAYLFI